MSVPSILLLTMAAAGTLYYILAALALVSHYLRLGRYRAGPPHPANTQPGVLPTVSVLKPVRGLDHGAKANFLSNLTQDYRDYEVLFGVLDSDDPAVPVISDAVAQCAAKQANNGFRHASLSIGSDIPGANNKVRILHSLAARATGEIIVITDADTRVAPDFLAAIVAPFTDPAVGVVTCMYRGTQAATIGDGLEGLHMTCVFAPGVASAWYLCGIDFGLGPAMALRRSVLEDMGGFESIVDYLADDFQLAYRARKAGYKVELSGYVVDVVLARESLRDVLTRELRWSRTTMISKPVGHTGLVISFGFAYAVLFWLMTGLSPEGWLVLGSVTVVRAVTAAVGARFCLDDREFGRRIHLLPLRDVLSFGVWIAGYFSRTVKWRGRKLRLRSGGKMMPTR